MTQPIGADVPSYGSADRDVVAAEATGARGTTSRISTNPRGRSAAANTRPDHPVRLKKLWWAALVLLLLVVGAIILAVVLTHRSTSTGGTVAVGNVDLTGDDAPTGARLDAYRGQVVTGNQARVVRDAGTPQKIGNGPTTDDDERFFVGSEAHQILVVVGNGTELAQALPPGHRISFTGTLKPFNGDPLSIGLDPKYANAVAKVGSYIEADPSSIRIQS